MTELEEGAVLGRGTVAQSLPLILAVRVVGSDVCCGPVVWG